MPHGGLPCLFLVRGFILFGLNKAVGSSSNFGGGVRSTILHGLFFLKLKGHFLTMKIALLCLFQDLRGMCPQGIDMLSFVLPFNVFVCGEVRLSLKSSVPYFAAQVNAFVLGGEHSTHTGR